MSKFKSFGLRSLHIAPLTDETAGTYGALIQLEGAQEFTCTPSTETTELIGDDVILESETQLLGYEFEFKNAIISFEALKVLEGGTVTDKKDGADLKIGEIYTNTSSDVQGTFGLVGKTQKAGDVHLALLKCKCESIEWSFVNKEYCILNGKGKALVRADGKLRNIIQHDTPQPVSIEDFE